MACAKLHAGAHKFLWVDRFSVDQSQPGRSRQGVQPASRKRYLDTIDILGETLAELQHQSARRTPDGGALVALAARLASERVGSDRFLSKVKAQCIGAIRSVVRQWPPVAAEPALDKYGKVQPNSAKRVFLTPQILRHAVRAAIAVVVAYGAAQALKLDYSYWATIATVVVMQPGASATWRRSIERILGSVAGGVIAAAGAMLLSTQGAVLLVIFPVAAATIALRSVSYTLFVAFLTPLFVFVSELL